MNHSSPPTGAYERALDKWSGSGMDTDTLLAFADYQRAKGLSTTTIRNRHSILTTLARKTGTPLLQITITDLRRHIGRDGVSAGTRRTERGAIRAFYEFACEDNLIDGNPAAKLPKIVAPRGTPRPFTAEQIDLMLTTGAYRRTRVMILLGYYQGFRVASIARVHGSDIDLKSNTIRVIGKGNKEAVLPLHPIIAGVAATMPENDWWFPARQNRGGPIHPASVTDRITRAKQRAGILDPRLTPHSLRHSFGTDLVGRGVDIRVVQELMMHGSLSTTQIYTGVSATMKQAAILTLPDRIVPDHSGRPVPLAA